MTAFCTLSPARGLHREQASRLKRPRLATAVSATLRYADNGIIQSHGSTCRMSRQCHSLGLRFSVAPAFGEPPMKIRVLLLIRGVVVSRCCG